MSVPKTLIDEIITEANLRGQAMDKEQAATQAGQAADREQALRDGVRTAYVQANGSDDGFESEWPALRADLVRQRTLAAVGDAPSTDVVAAFIAQQQKRR